MPPTPDDALADTAEVERLERLVTEGHASDAETAELERLLAQVADGDEVPDESDGVDQGHAAIPGGLE